jgi:hypothetical protein
MRALHLALTLAGLAGCTLANLTPTARFQDSAYTLNDAARWGQVDLAMQHVSPKYLGRFAERHAGWGEAISIAEIDLVRMKIAEDSKSAMSEISLSWYDEGGVTIHSSVITQTWEVVKGKFRLVDEAVRRGDPRVFATPATPTASGG